MAVPPHEIPYENFSKHAALRHHYLCQFRPALLDSTADREDAAAVARRHARGVEHVHGVFPGGAAGGLCLRSARFALAFASPTDRTARAALSRIREFADRFFCFVDQLGAFELRSVAVSAGVSGGDSRSAVLHHFEQQSAVTEM